MEKEQGWPQATDGRKEYTDDGGNVNKVAEWFGFELHLLVDVKHEVSLSYKITDTEADDGETLQVILDDAQANLPPGRIKTLSYDKAAETYGSHQLLHDSSIKPVIQNRSPCKAEHERMLPRQHALRSGGDVSTTRSLSRYFDLTTRSHAA